MHIPLGEVKDAYNEYVNNNRQNTDNVIYHGGHDGEGGEMVYCSDMEDDMFETILGLGSTEAIFYGHDHYNNFVLEYKGVKLSYGHSIDYAAYFGIGSRGYQRGCTVITVGDGETEIAHENYYQDKYESLYPKEEVNMEKNIPS
jgi:3',5'-cyclic AMP phosphodiesterase CpdA